MRYFTKTIQCKIYFISMNTKIELNEKKMT